MVTKDELKEHYKLACEIQDLQEEIEQLRGVAKTAGATKYGSTGGSSGCSDTIGKKLARLDEMIEHYIFRVEECMKQQERIEKEIERLPVNERRLMRYRYIDGLAWADIMGRMNYSWQGVHKIHAKALKRLAESKE